MTNVEFLAFYRYTWVHLIVETNEKYSIESVLNKNNGNHLTACKQISSVSSKKLFVH